MKFPLLAKFGGWLSRSFSGEQLATKATGYRLTETPGVLFGRNQSSAGVEVDQDSAMSLSSVFAAVNTLSSIIAALPLSVYRKTDRGAEIAENDAAHWLLHTEYNTEMTAFVARRTLEFHRLLWGNNYTEIVWAGNGRPRELWPIEPWRVEIDRYRGRLVYVVDGSRRLFADDAMHETLISKNGIEGESFIDYAITSLGLGIAAQEFSATFFGSGASPGGILYHDGMPQKEQRAEMRESWEMRHQGPGKAHRTAVLWGGWKYIAESGALSPEQAQLLETRRFTTEEVARWLNVPPHILRDLSRSTNNNIEHQGIEFIQNSIGPVLVMKEQEINRRILNPPSTYCKHNVDALLRGDSQARADYLNKLVSGGILTLNEARAVEDKNSIGPAGDVHFVPVNLQTLEKAIAVVPPPEAKPAPPPPEPATQPMGALDAPMQSLMADTFRRLIKKETNEGRRAAQKPAQFLAWADKFYDGFASTLADALSPVIEVVNTARKSQLRAEEIAGQYCGASRTELLEIAGQHAASKFTAAAESLYDSWDRQRAAEWAAKIMGENHA